MKKLVPSLIFNLLVLLTCTARGVPSQYAPTQVGTTSGGSQVGLYGYDTSGNRISKVPDSTQPNPPQSQIIAYGLIGKAVSISKGSYYQLIKHGPGGNRYLRANNDGSKTFYLPGMDYKIDANGNVTTTSIRINAKGYSPVAQVNINSSGTEYTYFVQDHLGSPIVSVDDRGDVYRRNRYDAWGQMTEATGVNHTPTVDDEKTRGYTGHELMAKFNLGQWNGRVFDYEIGMFTGFDRFIQGRSMAALNGYTLGQHRNPNVVDPSGWMFSPDDSSAESISSEGTVMASNRTETAATGHAPVESIKVPKYDPSFAKAYEFVEINSGEMPNLLHHGLEEEGVAVRNIFDRGLRSALIIRGKGEIKPPYSIEQIMEHQSSLTNEKSGFVATSEDIGVSLFWSDDVFIIRRPPDGSAVNVNQELGNLSSKPFEKEIAIPNRVRSENIHGVVSRVGKGEFLFNPNPNFRGERIMLRKKSFKPLHF